MDKKQTPFNEDFFSFGTRLEELSRLLVIIAEDTDERADSPKDVQRNMSTLSVVISELDRLGQVCEAWDNLRVKCPHELAQILYL